MLRALHCRHKLLPVSIAESFEVSNYLSIKFAVLRRQRKRNSKSGETLPWPATGIPRNYYFCIMQMRKSDDAIGGSTKIDRHLRTVPTIVSAHTFCASRKTLFKRALGLTLMQSTTLLMKAKFCYCDQIKFNEPILKPGTPK